MPFKGVFASIKSMSDKNLELENNTDSRIYEVGYLLAPTIDEGGIPAVYGNLKELISSLNGEIISDEIPRIRELAYTLGKDVQNVRSKFDTAYFGWTKFEMEPEKVLELKKKLGLDPNFLRFLIIKAIKENTIVAKRFVRRDIVRRKTPGIAGAGNEVPVEINKEEIDKEIDAMVAV